jgi:8-oxo-dGTP diphosphatase
VARVDGADRAGSQVNGIVVGCRRADGRWLLIRRSAGVPAPLKVCFPGGHVEPGERQAEAVVREMREELGAEVEPIRRVWQRVLDARPVKLWGWLASLRSTELTPEPAEVDEVLWLTAEEAARHPDGLPHTNEFLAALVRASDSSEEPA